MNNDYVYQPMLTCLGNKRKLVYHIRNVVEKVSKELNRKVIFVDAFAGSNVVSRSVYDLCSSLYVNDLETYANILAKCYLKRPSENIIKLVEENIKRLNDIVCSGNYVEGIISLNYAPKDTSNIKYGERCFYTRENALIIDTFIHHISLLPDCIKDYILGTLLVKASIHTNTSGVFKAFHKGIDGIGKWGGKGDNALYRIMEPIRLQIPIWHKCENDSSDPIVNVYQMDANDLYTKLPDNVDIVYCDPPYNQHPYGSNYFLLNIIANNRLNKDNNPCSLSRISGIPDDWNRSLYNYKNKAWSTMKDMIDKCLTKSKYVLISYNDEGFIDDWTLLLKSFKVEKFETSYNSYKGGRRRGDQGVIEILLLISNHT
jgi:adenine-specific DNA-methyltransferase